ncbi:MAG: response regulator [Patescibacteria group bacterium]|nr:response regulator [Patescibacteria group bacterium]
MGKRILIIDDDKDILEALQDLLEMEGYTVRLSPRGDNVIEEIASFRPGVILLDLLLSGKDGATICREIKRTEHIKHIPVLIMSAHPYAQKAIEGSGASEFLRKPFDVEQLLDLLTKYIASA